MKRILLLTLLLALPVHAGEDTDIVRFAEQLVRDFAAEVPSMGIAVVRGGKTVLVRGVGYRDLAGKIPSTADTAYYIASSTKSYTGLLCAVLAERGVVNLDAPVTKYLPELTLPKEGVTLRTLLSHTSGLSNDAIVVRTAFTGEHTPEQLIRVLGQSKLIEPKFQYDNLGYVVAGLVLQRVTGKKWQDLLDQTIFTPLKMDQTTAYMSEALKWPLAVPYDMNRELQLSRMTMVKTDATMHAAGGIVTTPRDLARWLEANINDGKAGRRQVLPAAAFQEVHRQQATTDRTWYRFHRTGYGFGWYLSDYEGDLLIHHFGGFEGWRAHVSYMPDKKIGVAIVTNTSGVGAAAADVMAAYIYDRLLGKDNIEAKYRQETAKLRTRMDETITRVRADLERRSKRAPSLTRDPNAYTGTYTNEKYGALTIAPRGNGLSATIGQLRATLEPFTEPESARVELIEGTGEVLRFVFASAPQADAIKWRDETFQRSR